MKQQYTEAARKELDEFLNTQQSTLEQIIADRKYVFGDDFIEITASDVRQASEYFRVSRPSKKRWSAVRLASIFYLIVGVLIAFGGLLYPSIESFIHENTDQALYVGMGLAMIITGFAGLYYAKIRQRHEYDFLRSRAIEREMEWDLRRSESGLKISRIDLRDHDQDE